MIRKRLTAPNNYFNYFTEIEERFQQRRGSILLLSTLDWALIETWREAGIPLEAALRGIDAAFDKYEARQKRGRMRRINGLAWCAQAVMDAAEELREAAAGTAPAPRDHATPASSTSASPPILKPPPPLSKPPPSRPKPAPPPPERLRELAAELRAPQQETAPTGAPPLKISKPSNAPSPSSKKNSSPPLPPPRPKIARWPQGARRPRAGPLPQPHGRRATPPGRAQFVQKQLLVHYNLPRLSLFYMSQQ